MKPSKWAKLEKLISVDLVALLMQMAHTGERAACS